MQTCGVLWSACVVSVRRGGRAWDDGEEGGEGGRRGERRGFEGVGKERGRGGVERRGKVGWERGREGLGRSRRIGTEEGEEGGSGKWRRGESWEKEGGGAGGGGGGGGGGGYGFPLGGRGTPPRHLLAVHEGACGSGAVCSSCTFAHLRRLASLFHRNAFHRRTSRKCAFPNLCAFLVEGRCTFPRVRYAIACLPVLWQVCGGGGPSSSSSCNLRFSAFLFAASNLNLRSSPPPSAFTLPTPTFPSSHLSAVLYCFSFMISVLLFSDLPFVSTLLSPSFSPPSSFPPSPFYPSLSSVPPHHESPKLHMRYNQHVLR
ncbi:unnamed protein product [Closterium sp. NIES-65]|nr:unnamed protein product [Closterium sp. NIES-65]